MKIYSWNVNGIRAIQKKGFLDWVKEEQPDILCIQETKAHPDQLDDELLNIEGYESYFSSAQKKGYSGTCIYTKIKPNWVEYGIGIDVYDSEGRFVICGYDEFTILNVYFPNGKQSDERLKYKMDFYEETLQYINERVGLGEKIILCGDYNTAHNEIDLKNPKSNSDNSGFLPIERAWMDKLESNGYIDTYRDMNPEKVEYSWWSYRFKARERNVGWRLDYHYVSDNLKDKVADTAILTEVLGSDHCPVTLELDF